MVETMEMPAGLSEKAKAIWPEVERELKTATNPPTGIALTLFCETYARWKAANDEVAAAGIIIKTESGYPVQAPALAIANKAQEQLTRMMSEFGMTSSGTGKPASEGKPGKKEERARAAENASQGKFAAGPPPRKLQLVKKAG